MSLKAFHIVFILASILLSFGVAAGTLLRFADGGRTGDLVYGLAAAMAGIALSVYGVYVLKKLKHISYL